LTGIELLTHFEKSEELYFANNESEKALNYALLFNLILLCLINDWLKDIILALYSSYPLVPIESLQWCCLIFYVVKAIIAS